MRLCNEIKGVKPKIMANDTATASWFVDCSEFSALNSFTRIVNILLPQKLIIGSAWCFLALMRKLLFLEAPISYHNNDSAPVTQVLVCLEQKVLGGGIC